MKKTIITIVIILASLGLIGFILTKNKAENEAKTAYGKFFEQFNNDLAQKEQLERTIENLKAEISDLQSRLAA